MIALKECVKEDDPSAVHVQAIIAIQSHMCGALITPTVFVALKLAHLELKISN